MERCKLDLLRELSNKGSRKHFSDEEHRMQVACVNWFRLRYPKLKHNLFAVPNGARRDKVTGAKLKAEGVLPGVADLILLKSNSQYHALLIEMKTRAGRQSETQCLWQTQISSDGYKYIVCRSLDEFQNIINDYLKDKE